MPDMPWCPPARDPVFVLCGARSGSTLLRFILDAHPRLACPPETNLPALAVQLAHAWSAVSGTSTAIGRDVDPAEIDDRAAEEVRDTIGRLIARQLGRRRKQLFCEKSLGTAQYATFLRRVYPDGKFICLHRHPMDVIASAVEACPWGLNGYGFDQYAAGSPGNVINALAMFWVDNTAMILAVEGQFPDSCHRVRYEDLVSEPEVVAERIFDFIGVSRWDGITKACFGPERERFGASDHKIWHTSGIGTHSVGRGWGIPAGLISLPVLERLNGLATQLGYVPVDDNWGTAAVPADVRADRSGTGGAASCDGWDSPVPLTGQLTRALACMGDDFLSRWTPYWQEPFRVIVVDGPGAAGAHSRQWRVDLRDRTVTCGDGVLCEVDDTAWDIVGSAAAWQDVLKGEVNFAVALRRCELRYCDNSEAAAPSAITADSRIGMLSSLLQSGATQGSAVHIRNGQAPAR